MPRKELEFDYTVETLSIVDEEGNVDKALEPKLSDKELLDMFRWMLYSRRVDERQLNLQRQGRIGTFPQSTGHEAIGLGSVFAIEKSDWFVPAYRELVCFLYRGWPLERLLLYWAGFEEGAVPPEGVNDLPICVPVASQLLHASGIGMANNIKGENKVVLTYFGDGSSSEGDFHEGINFAAVFNAPVIFVCENNQFAISEPLHKQTRTKTIAQKAVGYGVPGVRVDGNDVLAVYVATKEAIERARKGEGPTLLDCLTYRYTPHTTADDPKKYRSDEEAQKWAKREPLIRFAKYLEKKGLLNDEKRQKMETEIDEEIKEAVKKMETLAKSKELMEPLAMFDFLYADVPVHLEVQKHELAESLGRGDEVSTKSNPQRSIAGTAKRGG
ncbi:MAG: pyruvate dehydrogenase (acetyl-transferring) E1 component subunit alpha [Candidatus Obscuribacterales bacterium]|nr:pyruvate dehydrogenase (acetyl-transferring) E1 component subunit alpha [Candidatus Obscuribacterales bacterium]